MVIDASPILAVLFDEPTADWVTRQLVGHTTSLVMSTVNLTEVLIRVQDRRQLDPAAVLERLTQLDVRLMPPSVAQAEIAASARLRFPINLGDCFAYALSVVEDCPILTLDDDFRRTDRPLVMPEP